MPVDFQSSLASLLRSFAMVASVVQLAKRGLKDGSCCLQNRGSVIPGSMDGSLQRWCKILWRQFRVHILV